MRSFPLSDAGTDQTVKVQRSEATAARLQELSGESMMGSGSGTGVITQEGPRRRGVFLMHTSMHYTLVC